MLRERLRILGAGIRDLRVKRGMTQATLAEAADLSTNYVGEVERGEAQATLECLFAIARVLEVRPSALFVPLDRPLSRKETLARLRELTEQMHELVVELAGPSQ